MEIELKLLIAADDVARLRALPLLAELTAAPAQTETLLSTYFDTPQLHLKQHRSALRVRKSGALWIQTFKGGGRVEGGLHQRHEWECPVSGPQLELASLLAHIDNPAAAEILALPDLMQQLQPVFTTDFERTTWMLQLPQQTVVELALDQGVVSAGAASVAISEVELELKSGELQVLLDFAQTLKQLLPLQPSNISKAQRGFALRFPQQDSSL
jgi:triphosphatase